MPGSSGLTWCGVRDDGTSAAPGGAGPLEEYAARFDDLFSRVAQRRGFGSTWRGCWRVLCQNPP